MKRLLGRDNNVRLTTAVFRITTPEIPGYVGVATEVEQQQAYSQGMLPGSLFIEWDDGDRSWHRSTELLIEI